MKNEIPLSTPVVITWRTRVADYAELLKPELTGLSVLTALCGFYLASETFNVALLLWTAAGTLLVGGGAGALNQFVEREYDSLMKRTERRPLPAKRLEPQTVLWFGIACSVTGAMILFFAVNVLAGLLGALTLGSYLFLYTPSKRITPHATLVGAVPGALPPVIGWAAGAGTLDAGAWVLFGILFFWQMPHFLSLAWMYRKDYARAGYRMLTVLDERGVRTGRHILLHCSLLVPVSLSATAIGLTGWMYAVGALLLGLAFVLVSVMFLHHTSVHAVPMKANRSSRQLFFASLLYLPALMFLMTVDKL